MSKQIEVTYTECKTFGCAWTRFNPLVPPRGDVTMSIRCPRCKSERHDQFNRHTGDLVDRTYNRPKDWKDLGVRLTRGELRVAMIKAKVHSNVRLLRAVS